MSTYFVLGATGRTGRHLVDQLIRQGHSVRTTYRDVRGQSVLDELGATTALLDLGDGSVAHLASLMTGVDGVVFAAGAQSQSDARRIDQNGSILAVNAARAAGVQRFVQLSSIGAGTSLPPEVRGPQFARVYAAKRAADAHLRASGLDWTILEPGWLTDSAGSGRIEAATTGLPAAETPRADVAATIAAVLATPSTIGRQFEVIGGRTRITQALRNIANEAPSGSPPHGARRVRW